MQDRPVVVLVISSVKPATHFGNNDVDRTLGNACLAAELIGQAVVRCRLKTDIPMNRCFARRCTPLGAAFKITAGLIGQKNGINEILAHTFVAISLDSRLKITTHHGGVLRPQRLTEG